MFALRLVITLLVALSAVIKASNSQPSFKSENDDHFLLPHKRLISRRLPADIEQLIKEAPMRGGGEGGGIAALPHEHLISRRSPADNEQLIEEAPMEGGGGGGEGGVAAVRGEGVEGGETNSRKGRSPENRNFENPSNFLGLAGSDDLEWKRRQEEKERRTEEEENEREMEKDDEYREKKEGEEEEFQRKLEEEERKSRMKQDAWEEKNEGTEKIWKEVVKNWGKTGEEGRRVIQVEE